MKTYRIGAARASQLSIGTNTATASGVSDVRSSENGASTKLSTDAVIAAAHQHTDA